MYYVMVHRPHLKQTDSVAAAGASLFARLQFKVVGRGALVEVVYHVRVCHTTLSCTWIMDPNGGGTDQLQKSVASDSFSLYVSDSLHDQSFALLSMSISVCLRVFNRSTQKVV